MMIDLEEKSRRASGAGRDDHRQQADPLATPQYGLIPMVIPPLAIDPPLPIERIPVQQAPTSSYLQQHGAAPRLRLLHHARAGAADQHGLLGAAAARSRCRRRRSRSTWGRRPTSTRSASSSNAHGADAGERPGAGPPDQPGAAGDDLRQHCGVPLSAQPAWLVQQPNVRRRQFRESGVERRRRPTAARRGRPTPRWTAR